MRGLYIINVFITVQKLKIGIALLEFLQTIQISTLFNV
jgi:hypothetical protein